MVTTNRSNLGNLCVCLFCAYLRKTTGSSDEALVLLMKAQEGSKLPLEPINQILAHGPILSDDCCLIKGSMEVSAEALEALYSIVPLYYDEQFDEGLAKRFIASVSA